MLNWLLLWLLVVASAVQGQGVPAENRICLWSVQTPTTELFLLGSVHAVKADMYPLADAFERAYRQSDTLVVEVNLFALQPSDLLSLQEKGSYSDGDTIENNLTPDTLKLLTEYLARENLEIEGLRSSRPWLLTITLAIRQITALGYDPAEGIDNYFLKRAIKGGKRILELEKFAEQIGLLADEPAEIQELILKTNLVDLEETAEMLKVLIDAWKKGDVDEMVRIAMQASEEYPELKNWMNKLINQRNLRMVEKIKGYLTEQGTFLVIAGALHMGGEQGIVNLLRQQFTVTQLTSD